jgi:hypothetical protein
MMKEMKNEKNGTSVAGFQWMQKRHSLPNNMHVLIKEQYLESGKWF